MCRQETFWWDESIGISVSLSYGLKKLIIKSAIIVGISAIDYTYSELTLQHMQL